MTHSKIQNKRKKRKLARQTKPTRMVSMEEVARHVGLSVSSIYKLIAQNKFGKGVLLTTRKRAWALDYVDSWLDAKIAESEEVSK